MATPAIAGATFVHVKPLKSQASVCDVLQCPCVKRSRVDLHKPDGPTKTTNFTVVLDLESTPMNCLDINETV